MTAGSFPPPRLKLAGLAPTSPVEVQPPWSLRTSRLTIRRLMPTDREAFLHALDVSRDALARHCPIHREGEDDERLFRRLLMPDGGDGPGLPSLRCVGVLDDGRIAGSVNLIGIRTGLERRADLNWWTTAGFTGRGLATEMVVTLLAHALAEAPPYANGLGLHTVDAWITRDNAASARVAAKAGFRPREEKPSFLRTGDRWVLHDLYTRRADDPEVTPSMSHDGGEPR